MEHCGVLPTTQFAYRKGLGTCDALLCVSHTLQSALESGQEAGLCRSTCVCTDKIVSVLTQFLSNRSQYVLVDGCRCKLVNVVSGVLQVSVLGMLLFLLYTSELFYILENKLIGYADDSTLMAVVPSKLR